MTMKDAREKEGDFFKGKPEYTDLQNVGTTFLAEKLSNHLIGAACRGGGAVLRAPTCAP